MSSLSSPWRSRLGLLLLFVLLIAANIGVLIVYRVFYEDRLGSLVQEQQELLARKDETRKSLEKLREREKQLTALQVQLESFFSDTLGTRKERLAPLIEDIYKMTGEAGLRPSSISYTEGEVPGAQRIGLDFAIDGKYKDVKKLLYAFETSPRFLVVENVTVSFNDTQPEILRVAISLSHFFRSEATRVPKKVGRTGAGKEKRAFPPPPVPQKGKGRS